MKKVSKFEAGLIIAGLTLGILAQVAPAADGDLYDYDYAKKDSYVDAFNASRDGLKADGKKDSFGELYNGSAVGLGQQVETFRKKIAQKSKINADLKAQQDINLQLTDEVEAAKATAAAPSKFVDAIYKNVETRVKNTRAASAQLQNNQGSGLASVDTSGQNKRCTSGPLVQQAVQSSGKLGSNLSTLSNLLNEHADDTDKKREQLKLEKVNTQLAGLLKAMEGEEDYEEGADDKAYDAKSPEALLKEAKEKTAELKEKKKNYRTSFVKGLIGTVMPAAAKFKENVSGMRKEIQPWIQEMETYLNQYEPQLLAAASSIPRECNLRFNELGRGAVQEGANNAWGRYLVELRKYNPQAVNAKWTQLNDEDANLAAQQMFCPAEDNSLLNQARTVISNARTKLRAIVNGSSPEEIAIRANQFITELFNGESQLAPQLDAGMKVCVDSARRLDEAEKGIKNIQKSAKEFAAASGGQQNVNGGAGPMWTPRNGQQPGQFHNNGQVF